MISINKVIHHCYMYAVDLHFVEAEVGADALVLGHSVQKKPKKNPMTTIPQYLQYHNTCSATCTSSILSAPGTVWRRYNGRVSISLCAYLPCKLSVRK